DESNPHSIEYLPNGNVAVAGSIGDWIRVYTASQGSTSSKYVQVTLEGAHGVLWDPDRQILWCLGTEEIVAYSVGGTAASPTLKELTQYHANFTDAIRSGHDLSPVYGNKDRLWISSKTVMQYDIPTASFVTAYDEAEVIAHNSVKGISNFPDSDTIVYVYPNNTYLTHDSDRIFVSALKDGKFYGITHTHSTGAYYKVRTWSSAYTSEPHRSHRATVVPGTDATCTESGKTAGSFCSICGVTMTPQEVIPAKGHTVVTVSALAPGCTTDGLTEGSYCSVCNTVLSAQKVLPATGHTYTYTRMDARMHLIGCESCDYAVDATHSFADGLCLCGEQEHKEPVEDSTLKLSHSLNLASDISVNFVVPKTMLTAYDMDTVYVESVLDVYEGNVKVGTKTIRMEGVDNGYTYYFTLTGLTAVQMNDRISTVLYGTKDGQAYCSPADDYAIADYAYSQLNKTNTTDKLRTLCADLLRYGTKAQIYKNYRTESPADGALTAEHRAYLSQMEELTFGNVNEDLKDLENAPVVWVGKTLNLESKVCLKFVFKTTAYTGELSDLSLRVSYEDRNGEIKTVTVPEAEAYSESAQLYSFTVDSLLAAELRSVVSVQIYAGETPVSTTLLYSPDTYGNGKTGTLLELCKALFAYSDSAKQYFTA
ncbi:MAG: hypothetical protein IKT58_00570, partial [Oscillospiraceae bacterium]|nr:hypothetical protein [Oscillospiraceae bacterium]